MSDDLSQLPDLGKIDGTQIMVPVEITLWLPKDRMTIRGVLTQLDIDTEVTPIEFGGGWFPGVERHTEYVATERTFRLSGRNRLWKFDKHRVPRI